MLRLQYSAMNSCEKCDTGDTLRGDLSGDKVLTKSLANNVSCTAWDASAQIVFVLISFLVLTSQKTLLFYSVGSMTDHCFWLWFGFEPIGGISLEAKAVSETETYFFQKVCVSFQGSATKAERRLSSETTSATLAYCWGCVCWWLGMHGCSRAPCSALLGPWRPGCCAILCSHAPLKPPSGRPRLAGKQTEELLAGLSWRNTCTGAPKKCWFPYVFNIALV